MWWSRQERELNKELRFPIEGQIEENLRAGMSPAEARRQARLVFGVPRTTSAVLARNAGPMCDAQSEARS